MRLSDFFQISELTFKKMTDRELKEIFEIVDKIHNQIIIEEKRRS